MDVCYFFPQCYDTVGLVAEEIWPVTTCPGCPQRFSFGGCGQTWSKSGKEAG